MTDSALPSAAYAGALIAEAELAAIPEWIWNGVELPVPVDRIAEDFYGFLIEEHDLAQNDVDRYVSGLLDPVRRRIVVDRLEAARAPGRRRFTIAHELGHWVIHQQPSIRVSTRQPGQRQRHARGENALPPDLAWIADYPQAEMDANQFAAAVLVPQRLLEPTRQGTADLDQLARWFAVSRQAMERRLAFLEAVSHATEDRPVHPVGGARALHSLVVASGGLSGLLEVAPDVDRKRVGAGRE